MMTRSLSPEHLEARIEWRVCQLEELAARTACAFWRGETVPIIQNWSGGLLSDEEASDDG